MLGPSLDGYGHGHGVHSADGQSVEGSADLQRLPIASFVVRAPGGEVGQVARYLHHNFVCALLNDLFGIQARISRPLPGQL